jgi:uncharacterized alkaline shock family protein YloU
MGVALIHANIPGVTQSAFDLIPPLQSWEAAGIGGLMILLAMLYLVTFAPHRPKMRYISYDSGADGSVSISDNAVRDYIRKLSGEFSTVVSIDPKIKAERNGISIDLNVELVAGSRIPELSQMLQSRVRESLRDGLGIADVKDIKVRVHKIAGESSSSRRGWRS